MWIQYQWPEPGYVISIDSTPQATPLTRAISFKALIENIAIFPTNFSVGPAPTTLTIIEYFDEDAEIETARFVFSASDLTEDEWRTKSLGDFGGSRACYDRYYQIYCDTGTLDLRGIGGYEEGIEGATVFGWFDPVP